MLVPLAVYLLSWTGWFVSDIGWDRQWAATRPAGLPLVPDALRSLWHYHRRGAALPRRAVDAAPVPVARDRLAAAGPAGVLLLPAGHHAPVYGCEVASCAREVLALGNPVLWWGTLPVLAALLWLWVARRDWRAAALLAIVAAGIVPWLRDDLREPHDVRLLRAAGGAVHGAGGGARRRLAARRPGRARGRRRRWGAAAVGTYTALAVAAFAFFYPVLAAVTIPLSEWQERIWLHSWV